MFCSEIGETCKFSYLLANDNIIFLVLNIYLNFKMEKTNPFYTPVIYNLQKLFGNLNDGFTVCCFAKFMQTLSTFYLICLTRKIQILNVIPPTEGVRMGNNAKESLNIFISIIINQQNINKPTFQSHSVAGLPTVVITELYIASLGSINTVNMVSIRHQADQSLKRRLPKITQSFTITEKAPTLLMTIALASKALVGAFNGTRGLRTFMQTFVSSSKTDTLRTHYFGTSHLCKYDCCVAGLYHRYLSHSEVDRSTTCLGVFKGILMGKISYELKLTVTSALHLHHIT